MIVLCTIEAYRKGEGNFVVEGDDRRVGYYKRLCDYSL